MEDAQCDTSTAILHDFTALQIAERAFRKTLKMGYGLHIILSVTKYRECVLNWLKQTTRLIDPFY